MRVVELDGLVFARQRTPGDGDCFLHAVGDEDFDDARHDVCAALLRDPEFYADAKDIEETGVLPKLQARELHAHACEIAESGTFFEFPSVRAWCTVRQKTIAVFILTDSENPPDCVVVSPDLPDCIVRTAREFKRLDPAPSRVVCVDVLRQHYESLRPLLPGEMKRPPTVTSSLESCDGLLAAAEKRARPFDWATTKNWHSAKGAASV